MNHPCQMVLGLTGGYAVDRPIPERSHRRRLRGIDRCESPIELRLAASLCASPGFTPRTIVDPPSVVGQWRGNGYELRAQHQWERYRVDFALLPCDQQARPRRVIIVEVDGHEWHERTKEQAEYDRARDRYMTSTGAAVLRFTGREIWRDATLCAQEVLSLAELTR